MHYSASKTVIVDRIYATLGLIRQGAKQVKISLGLAQK